MAARAAHPFDDLLAPLSPPLQSRYRRRLSRLAARIEAALEECQDAASKVASPADKIVREATIVSVHRATAYLLRELREDLDATAAAAARVGQPELPPAA